MTTEPEEAVKVAAETSRSPVAARSPLPVSTTLPGGPLPIKGGGPPVTPPPAPGTFIFSVSSMTVKNPRSLFNDTDYATLAINALAADGTVIQQYGPVAQSLGNLGKGRTIDLGMSIPAITVPDGGSLAIAFVVVNKGGWSWDSVAINALELAGAGVVGALSQGAIAGATVTTVAADGTATVAPAVLSLSEVIPIGLAIIAVLEGINILFADCDGTVVPGAITIGKTELLQLATPGPWNFSFEYPGTNSPDGCGANSDYVVAYNVAATPAPVVVPNVDGMSILEATQVLADAGLIAIEKVTKFAAKLEPTVLGQTPAAGSLVAPHSEIQCDVAGPPVIPPPPKGHQTQ
jgi:hypothetical protein